MDLTYTIPHASPLLVPKAPAGRHITSLLISGTYAQPVLTVAITALPPIRRGQNERHCLWLVNGRGTTNGCMAMRESYEEAMAVAGQFKKDFDTTGMEVEA